MKWSGLGFAMLAASLSSPAWADAKGEVHAAFEKAMAQKSYVATTRTQVRGRTVESRIAVQTPDRFHMKTDESEVIVIPGGSWMKQGGQWMRLPMDMSAMVRSSTLTALREASNLVKDVRQTGSGVVGGCEATNYSYRTEGKVMGFDAAATVELSVCDDTGLPVQVVSEDAKGKQRTTVTYDFRSEVDIRPPN